MDYRDLAYSVLWHYIPVSRLVTRNAMQSAHCTTDTTRSAANGERNQPQPSIIVARGLPCLLCRSPTVELAPRITAVAHASMSFSLGSHDVHARHALTVHPGKKISTMFPAKSANVSSCGPPAMGPSLDTARIFFAFLTGCLCVTDEYEDVRKSTSDKCSSAIESLPRPLALGVNHDANFTGTTRER